ncbi:MAG: twin-arginine translocase TatA/TatE family subunit [Vulcanimicrobiaceae bacterium]
MLSAADIAILGAVALLVFGPEQLPKVARKVGSVMRDVQNTSQQFIREMERAADEPERPHLEAVPSPYDQAVTDPVTVVNGQSDEPMLPGIEPAVEPPAPKKVAEPVEF